MTTGADVVALVVTGAFSIIFISLTLGTFRRALAGDAAASAERLLPATVALRLNLLGVASAIAGKRWEKAGSLELALLHTEETIVYNCRCMRISFYQKHT